jgi:hypothetical protein
MEKQFISKKNLLLYTRNATQNILNSLVAIKFIKADLYIVTKDIYAKLLEIDSLLLPHKKDTRKTNIYSIGTFVNILNPTNVAFTYTLTPVYKRKQISDFSKIQLALAREYAVSVKMLHHDFDEYIKNNDISELTYQEKLQELNERLKLEKQYYEAINNNPDEYMYNKLKIATQPILHGQIRYYYINEEGEKEDMQRHLSSEIPNILVFDENSGFTKRKDNKIDAFLENSIRVFGNVYMRKD